jgi:chromosome segregation ATPase
MVRTLACGLSVFLASALLGAQSLPSAQGSDRTLRELLDEVRLLRQVLQSMSLGSVRAQILLARRLDHQSRLLQLDRQINGVRDEARETQGRVEQLDDQIDQGERKVSSESDPSIRSEREAQLKELGWVRDQAKRRLDSLRQQELDLSTSQSQEQAKLAEAEKGLDRIEGQLDALQKSVSPGAPPH